LLEITEHAKDDRIDAPHGIEHEGFRMPAFTARHGPSTAWRSNRLPVSSAILPWALETRQVTDFCGLPCKHGARL
jgi:hypothetical protein